MTTPRPSRCRRILKRAGLVVCLLVFLVWGLSLRWEVWWNTPRISGRVEFGVLSGFWKQYGEEWTTRPTGVYRGTRRAGWDAAKRVFIKPASPLGFRWPKFSQHTQRFRSNRNVEHYHFLIPCWLLFLITATPTAFIWWRDHSRIPPGHCQKCGYNLTGNESGVCPECGKPIPKRS